MILCRQATREVLSGGYFLDQHHGAAVRLCQRNRVACLFQLGARDSDLKAAFGVGQLVGGGISQTLQLNGKAAVSRICGAEHLKTPLATLGIVELPSRPLAIRAIPFGQQIVIVVVEALDLLPFVDTGLRGLPIQLRRVQIVFKYGEAAEGGAP